MTGKLHRAFKWLMGFVVAATIGYATYNTSINNAYQYGATVWDSTEFATVIWRSGWTLNMAPVFGKDMPFFVFHSSPIQYIPNLFSYVFPGDRITYYALVYALLYAAMLASAFRLLSEVMPSWLGTIAATIGAFALFCSQPLSGGSWEMRVDYASPLFAILAFRAWQLRRYRQAALWLALNAGVREDVGVIYAIPLAMLALVQWLNARSSDPGLARERLRRGIALVLLSAGLAVASYLVQTSLFPVFDQLHVNYFSRDDPFGHVTRELLLYRAENIFYYKSGIWLPLLWLFVAGTVFGDMRLLVGVLGFVPYVLAMFLSKTDISGMLSSYKPFPLVLAMVWPALMALDTPRPVWRRYIVLQFVMLASGMSYFSANTPYAKYLHWSPRPLTENIHLYRQFGEQVLDKEQPFSGKLRASHGVIALYPYQFPIWWESNVVTLRPEDEGKIETIIWFDGDRDSWKVKEMLEKGNFSRTLIPGTRIMIGRKLPEGETFDPRGVIVEPLP